MEVGVRDRGQVLPLLVLVVLVVVLCALLMARVGAAVHERGLAKTAADASALAGAAQGRREAEILAERNGARLEHYVEAGGQVEVTVRLGDTQATSRAASR